MPDPAGHDPARESTRGEDAARAPGLDAAEQESLFSHPRVPADASASYGEHPDQVVDFYAPRGAAGHAPLVVVLHGGSWRARVDRAYMSPFADFLARRGFAVASVAYRRGPGLPAPGLPGQGGEPHAGRWPETFDDVAAALDALPALVGAALPQADVRRTVVTGHSAGGHLALWAAARHVLPQGTPWRLPEPPPLRGVVALAPLADLALSAELALCEGAVEQLLGGADGGLERRLAATDPALLLPTGIATTVVQGREDTTVPERVAESFVDAAAKAGETVGLTLLEGVGHFPLIDPAADACAVAAEEIAQLAY